jgi:hypothetical protein
VFDLALQPSGADVGARPELDDERRPGLPILHPRDENRGLGTGSHNAVVRFRLRVVCRVNEERRIRFDHFDLDLVNECLWRGSQPSS